MMKNALNAAAAAVAVAFATATGEAAAQSSVALYGTIDVAGRYVKNDNARRRFSEGTDGINGSQLGLTGKEDLGGGLSAGFTLLSTLIADTGTTAGKFWNRRSTVSLSGPFGEIRLGRDWTPSFWNDAIFDAFGATGMANSFNVHQTNQLGTYIRADNPIGYFLPPNLGGVYGQLMVTASEGASTNAGRYLGGRLGYSGGPVNTAFSYATTRQDALPGQPGQKSMSLGAWYDFGVVKLMGYFDRETLSYLAVNNRENRINVDLVFRLGVSELKVGGTRSRLNAATFDNNVSQWKLGYVYNLSKRTALFAAAARLSNGSRSQLEVAGGIPAYVGGAAGDLPPLNGKSTGAELGVRHFF